MVDNPKVGFGESLLAWAETLHRPMPWRAERDPYRIWLSEVILQQTRVAQGIDYYQRFLKAFPTVKDLAAAPLDEVMALWQGLGYYSRARNLHKAAQQVLALGGVFPTHYHDLLELPGIGPYTAAAIASFSSDEHVAVVDGNVYRVLARFFGLDWPIDKPAKQRKFAELAQSLLPPGKAASYNQAIMDFGAVQCKPRQPLCPSCPLIEQCVAFQQNEVQRYPLKTSKIARRRRYLDYVHLRNPMEQTWLFRRSGGDIWQGLYDLPFLESEAGLDESKMAIGSQTRESPLLQLWPELHSLAELENISTPIRHILTHQELIIRFWRYRVEANSQWYRASALGEKSALLAELQPEEGLWVDEAQLDQYGMPQPLANYLRDGRLTLGLR